MCVHFVGLHCNNKWLQLESVSKTNNTVLKWNKIFDSMLLVHFRRLLFMGRGGGKKKKRKKKERKREREREKKEEDTANCAGFETGTSIMNLMSCSGQTYLMGSTWCQDGTNFFLSKADTTKPEYQPFQQIGSSYSCTYNTFSIMIIDIIHATAVVASLLANLRKFLVAVFFSFVEGSAVFSSCFTDTIHPAWAFTSTSLFSFFFFVFFFHSSSSFIFTPPHYHHNHQGILGSCTSRIHSHGLLNDGDMFWEIRRLAISSLCKHHRVYSHKPRYYSLLHTQAIRYKPIAPALQTCTACYYTEYCRQLYTMVLYYIIIL